MNTATYTTYAHKIGMETLYYLEWYRTLHMPCCFLYYGSMTEYHLQIRHSKKGTIAGHPTEQS